MKALLATIQITKDSLKSHANGVKRHMAKIIMLGATRLFEAEKQVPGVSRLINEFF